MLGSWKSRAGILAVSALMVGVPVVGLAAPAGAAFHGGGGNSGNAHTCQKNGWRITVRADQTTFDNVGDCASYAAQGGTPTLAPSRPLCVAYGGTFVLGSGNVLWSCNGLPDVTVEEQNLRAFYLGIDCVRDGGNQLSWSNFPSLPENQTCKHV